MLWQKHKPTEPTTPRPRAFQLSSLNYYSSSQLPSRSIPTQQKPQAATEKRSRIRISDPLRRKVAAVAVVALLIGFGFKFLQPTSAQSSSPAGSANQTQNSAAPTTSAAIANSAGIIIVNKAHHLEPLQYTPAKLAAPDVRLRLAATNQEMQLDSSITPAVKALFDAAEQAGVGLTMSSGYRSFADQTQLYNYYVKIQGKELADTQSARPGYSEHQTGLALDVAPADGSCDAQACFASLPEGQWVAANAYKFGFIIRYMDGKTAITGYQYEPWHLRYVGTTIAQTLHDKGNPTLEEFYNISGGTTYK